MTRSLLPFVLMCGFLVASLPVTTQGSEITKLEHEFWTKLYQELHPGQHPKWSEYGGRHAWAKQEKKRLESTVVEILRGNRKDVPWKQGFFVAGDIATTAICDALYARMEPTLQRISAPGAQIGPDDHAKVVSSLSILAEAGDSRALDPLNRVVQSLDYSTLSHITARKYLTALQKVGTVESIKALRKMPLRKSYARIDRMAALTEKIIEARVEGRMFPSEMAPKELRAATQQFLKACEAADLEAYAECFPWGFHEVWDAHDMHEFLDGKHGKAALVAIRVALEVNEPFEIDREHLRATLDCDGRFLLEYIYEVDGWKVMNIKPFPPAGALHDVGPQENVRNNSPRRIFIGKAAKDSEKH